MWTRRAARHAVPAAPLSSPGEAAGRYALGDHVVVWARGEIDLFTAPVLRRQLNEAVGRNAARVIVDLSDVSFMDSSGVHALILALRTAQRGGGSVGLVGACRTVERVLVLSRLDELFPLHATMEQALDGG
jgi:anti-sigma B factor antagonist